MKSVVIFFSIVVLQQNGNIEATDWPVFDKISSGTSLVANSLIKHSEKFLNYYHNNVNKKVFGLFGYESLPTLRDFLSDDNEEKKVASDKNIDNFNLNTMELFQILFDHPNLNLTTPGIISYYDYHSESHEVITEDGYILTLHRIPIEKELTKSDPQKTVLLYHGLFGSSADWVLMGPRRSLAFILSDLGYDVWMANVRGNRYSKAHLKKDVNSFGFWNFTWHDVSQNDLPAIISYIIRSKKNKEQITYIGHSMGTTILFALLSMKPEYNRILKAGYALAPIAFMSDVTSPIQNLGKSFHEDIHLWQKLGVKEFSPPSSLLSSLSKDFCDVKHYDASICEDFLFTFFGYDYKQISKLALKTIKAHIPAGTSTKTVMHYLQEIRSGGAFQQFDYGAKGNLKQYGAEIPPIYPVSNITLPITLFSGENDWLASVSDVENLFQQLANPVHHYIVPYKDFSHLDFLFARNAPRMVYRLLLERLGSLT